MVNGADADAKVNANANASANANATWKRKRGFAGESRAGHWESGRIWEFGRKPGWDWVERVPSYRNVQSNFPSVQASRLDGVSNVERYEVAGADG